MQHDSNYFIEQPEEFDLLTEDDQNRVLNGETINQGDTGAEATEPEAEPEAEAEETQPAPEAEPELLAKDGKHTIPYAELENARLEAQNWKLQAEQQADLIKQLEAAKIQDAKTGGTEATDAVVEAYEGLFPEVAEDLKPYIQKMIDNGVKSALQQLEHTMNQRVAPVEQQLVQQQEKDHYSTILTAHPDAREVLNSDSFDAWGKAHPWILDAAGGPPLNCADILKQGSAADVNNLLVAYKETQAVPATPANPAVSKAAVKDKVAGVKPRPPGTFSDMPAGTLAASTETERILSMSDQELERTFLTMTEIERNKLFERLI